MKREILKNIFFALVIILFSSYSYAGEEIQLKFNPKIIAIGATYHGATLNVEGYVPEGTQAIINVIGKRSDVTFKKKGKALGVLWMNLGTVVFHNVPNLYLVYTGDMSASSNLPVGFKSIKEQITITPDSEDKDFLFNEFIKLKTKSGLYSINRGIIKYKKTSRGMRAFSCKVSLPAALVPGIYKLRLFAVNGNQISGTLTHSLKVIEKGIPSMVADLAYRHSTLYGIIASLMAIIAGLIMGILFKGGKGGH